MVSSQPALRPSRPHLHLKGFQCPVCEQPIPNERAEQVRSWMEARERELVDAVSTRLKEQFAADTAKITAENEAKALKENQETVLKERLQEQREALEKDKATALNAKDAKHFDENQKLKEKLDEALRKLEQKTAEEPAEGAEVEMVVSPVMV